LNAGATLVQGTHTKLVCPTKLWSDENMQRAVAAVEKQGES